MTTINKEQSEAIVKSLLEKAHSRFKQEFDGESEEFLDRVLRKHRAIVARRTCKLSQKWSMWDNDGVILTPDNTRAYYRKGKTEILILECPPQIRFMRFRSDLANRESSDAAYPKEDSVCQYSLALPYVIFLFRFKNGMFDQVQCVFCDRPLKRLEEKPLKPYLSNIDSTLKVCLGRDFIRGELIKDNIIQQSSFVLNHFWQTVYSDEWSAHFWNSKSHFYEIGDERMSSLEGWQNASTENPLFVTEDVQWLPHSEECFGDMIVALLEDESENNAFQEEIYNDLVDQFLEEIKKSFAENLDSVNEKFIESNVVKLGEELAQQISKI